MSEEVIKILDALTEKFGLAIDWTSANVLPYLQQLCGKYVTYEIATSVVWMLIGICLLFIGKYVIGKAKYCWGKTGVRIMIWLLFGLESWQDV